MHRNNLKTLLNDYHPVIVTEIQAKQEMLDFLSSNTRCFERSLCDGHFTASSWLMNKSQDKFLLTHHAKLNMWLQLGGHCDGDSDLLRVALKEANEESGLLDIVAVVSGIFDLDIHQVPARKGEPAHLHYDVRFLLQARQDTPLIVSNESHSLQWFGMDMYLLPTTEPAILRMFNKWLAFRQQCGLPSRVLE